MLDPFTSISPFLCELLQAGQCWAKGHSLKPKPAVERPGAECGGHTEATESEVPALAGRGARSTTVIQEVTLGKGPPVQGPTHTHGPSMAASGLG